MYSLPRYSIGDVVSVYDGNSIESPMLGQFCGPTPILPKYFSSSNEIFIWFLSSRYFGQEFGSGRFLMEYRTLSKNSKMIQCKIFSFCLLSFCQNERIQLSQFVYFVRNLCLFSKFLNDKMHNYFEQNITVNEKMYQLCQTKRNSKVEK